ncbi:hypothetical protein NDU88_007045 [Pleurodeles waltl]|uniref:Uncharacterized protein n=1 Tax=Pleurodeles waltl TaxID=8319 RepID=A0AAV7VNK5_PLEWA|nr:hypothetical protein NDU88_007045 [Pleurodeles waltl]
MSTCGHRNERAAYLLQGHLELVMHGSSTGLTVEHPMLRERCCLTSTSGCGNQRAAFLLQGRLELVVRSPPQG